MGRMRNAYGWTRRLCPSERARRLDILSAQSNGTAWCLPTSDCSTSLTDWETGELLRLGFANASPHVPMPFIFGPSFSSSFS
jgi:hypothetical protein